MTALRIAEVVAGESQSLVPERPALYVVGSASDPYRLVRERAQQRRSEVDAAYAREAQLALVKSYAIRVLVLLALVAVVISSGLLVGTFFSPSAVASDVYQVVQGDTLWDIASRVRGSYSIADMMALIQEINNLPDTGIVAGQVLLIPAG